MLARGDPVPLGGWVNLEHMRPCAEDGLLPVGGEHSQRGWAAPRGLRAKLGRWGLTWLWTLVRLGWVGSKKQPEGWQELRAQSLGGWGERGLVSVSPGQA